MTHLSKNITDLRKKCALNQQTVADYLNVSHTIISNYENGKYYPTHEHLTKLADLYDVEIADLFEENATHKMLNIAFAFRAEEISGKDVNGITQFKKIIKNYLKLHTIETE